MENFVERSLLYDFYGELLTARQRAIYEEVVLDDCSLGEVAENHDITRQGVHDLVKRCNASLDNYENKLHLVEKFLNVRGKVVQIKDLAEALTDQGTGLAKSVIALADEILEEL